MQYTEHATACGGFVSALLSVVMQNNKACLWSWLFGNLVNG
ncbi:hypothetical protein [Mucilaginibacter sp.]|nr:hypothetical protein [Mucilaginibacter sp.]